MKQDPKCNPQQAVAVASGREQNCASADAPIAPARRKFLRTSLIGGVAAAAATAVNPVTTHAFARSAHPRREEVPSFEFDEITIAALQDGMKSGKFTARSIAEKYLARIEAIDKHGPAVNSVIELNPDALAIADALDRERQDKRAARPAARHPGSDQRQHRHARPDADHRRLAGAGGIRAAQGRLRGQKLREAGAVILGKTNLSEWANIRSSHSTSGWSGRGGQTHNPYALDRNPCGSSSGSGAAVAANLCAVAIGTETDGSIVCPANANGIVGIKPTLGLVSRAGIIPIAHSQDTAGPMARTVTDAAILLGALAGIDGDDAATAEQPRQRSTPTTLQFLDAKGLRGARLGVVRKTFRLS